MVKQKLPSKYQMWLFVRSKQAKYLLMFLGARVFLPQASGVWLFMGDASCTDILVFVWRKLVCNFH